MNLSELCQRLNGSIVGNDELEIRGIASLEDAGPDEISFLIDPRYADAATNTKAGAILVSNDFASTTGQTLLKVEDVRLGLEKVLVEFAPERDRLEPGIHATAIVDDNVVLGNNVAIGPHAVIRSGTRIGDDSEVGPGCIIGTNVQIGDRCLLEANVVIVQRCRLGNRVIVHSNSTIGCIGFGFRTTDGQHHRVPHNGIVDVGDDVEIGSNSCIDRAKCGRTIIGNGTKIDNLVQIGHNVQTGEHCIICSQVGVSGSTKLGDYVVLGGQSGLVGHIRLGTGAQVGAKSGVTKSADPGARLVGFPARDVKQFHHVVAQTRRLPKMIEEIREIRARLDELKTS